MVCFVSFFKKIYTPRFNFYLTLTGCVVSRDHLSIDIDQGDEGGDTDSNKTEVNTLLKELLDGVAPS